MKSTKTVLFLFLLFVLSAGIAAAQDGALVMLKSEVLKETQIVNEQGEKETRLMPVSSAMPGDVLTFSISYVNEGDEDARDLVLTNPVPEHMIYEGGSAEKEGTVTSYSTDGGGTYGAPDSLTVTGDDGKERTALPSEYTHIRWQLVEPVAPGGNGTVTFRARVK